MDLVSIGVPVRNGAKTLREALDSLVAQTYREIEIIVTDNASTDATPEICREYQARDPRVRYVRHPATLRAMDNFRSAFDLGRGPYWMWAADDDLRSENYVETLVAGAKRHPGAALVFSDVAVFSDRTTRVPIERFGARDLEPSVPFGSNPLVRHADVMRTQLRCHCSQIYGMLRRACFVDYPWTEPLVGPDVPILHYLAGRGEFRHEPGALFLSYQSPANHGDGTMRLRSQRWWSFDEMTWRSARATAAAYRADAPAVAPLGLEVALFFAVGGALHGGAYGWARHYASYAYRRLPEGAKASWRSIKRFASRPSSGGGSTSARADRSRALTRKT